MKQKLKAIFTSVFLRYMLSYAVIMAVLFISVSVYMYNYYNNTIRQNVVDSTINTLSRIRYENEANISTLINIASLMGLSPYIAPFRFEEEPWNSYQLKKQMVLYNISSDFYDSLFLIFDIDDYLYSSTTSIKLDLFLDSIMRFERTPKEELNRLLRSHNGVSILPSQAVSSSLIDGRSQRMVTFVVPLGITQLQSVGSLLFLIEERAYLDLFADEISMARNTYIVNNGSVMVGSSNIDLPDSLILKTVNENTETLVTTIGHGGADYLLVSVPGQLNNMQYCTVLPLKAISQNMQNATIGFWIFLFALSVPCIFLTFYFAQRNYKPIRDLRHMFAESGGGADDFMVIQTGIRNLLGRNVDLNSRLDESVPMQKSNFIKNFVKRRYKNRRACVDMALKLGMDIDKRYFMVALFGMAPGADSPSIERLAELNGGDVSGFGVEVIALDQILHVLFSDDGQALDAWVKRALEKSRASGESITVSASSVHEDFKQATTAYLEATTAFDNRFIMGNAHVLRFEDVSAVAKGTVPHIRSYMDALKKSLRSGDPGEVNGVIDELFGYLGGIHMSLFSFRLIYNDIISVMLGEQMLGAGHSVDALHIYDVFSLSNCRSINDLDDMLRKLCHGLLQKKQPTQKSEHPEIEMIVEHMNENFADPNLNMSAIADRFMISAARLSLEFKELTGMSPSDYLLLLRMEKSKELLSTTELSIKDICAAVGYFEPSGFIRRFRQYLAMTPMQYRQNFTHTAIKR